MGNTDSSLHTTDSVPSQGTTVQGTESVPQFNSLAETIHAMAQVMQQNADAPPNETISLLMDAGIRHLAPDIAKKEDEKRERGVPTIGDVFGELVEPAIEAQRAMPEIEPLNPDTVNKIRAGDEDAANELRAWMRRKADRDSEVMIHLLRDARSEDLLRGMESVVSSPPPTQ